MTSKQNWQIGISTDTGPIKKRNEDSYYMKLIEDLEGHELMLVAIADGMGGYKAGDMASRIVISMLDQWWEKSIRKLLKKKDCLQRIIKDMNRIFVRANERLVQMDRKVGTTLSVLFLYKGRYAICHVGDSRIYQIKGGQIGFQNFFRAKELEKGLDFLHEQHTEALEMDVEMVQLTEDHSWVEQQIKRGNLTIEEARKHRKRNVLTQCLGIENGVQPSVQMGFYQSSDLFLLCSDGFYSMFSNEEITETILGLEKENRNLQTLSEYLVKLAKYSGTRDNITVILLRNIMKEDLQAKEREKGKLLSLFKKKR
ncbi:protein phosphatase 2C domain-containing protein [Lederbergia sp. NSJ-179]|uniref:PP2C family protein-serine/threonine phosphatase n=1 Tax=Lederbergia sp. NSJ-179 TaxID=2931402 RepID=UPI001FD59220|nr:protein phosphatase 2C domain-containing protein [Lederbergia sp. NSJ-179]MCJ7840235.1 protein phosphatase 2C domain-containing protein [Lederbergia sp. NSJ-179]